MLTDLKKSILRDHNYVYLDGSWRHKGDDPDLSAFIVNVLGEAEFEAGIDRYVSALNRNIHCICIGREL
jgi:hypothetical protein